VTAPRRKLISLIWIALRHRLDLCLPRSDKAPILLRTCLWLLNLLLPKPVTSDGKRLRDAFIELGPVYIKFGQLLSTRRDLLSDDIALPLADLQDNVGPLADFSIYDFASRSLGEDWQNSFRVLDAQPLASASIAQVHAAELLDGTEVVVKIVRPDIGVQINADMQLLAKLARFLDRNSSEAKRLHLPQIVADHHEVLLSELDMYHEARNQIQLRRNFADSDLLYVPRVYASLSRADLLVMERIQGIPIGQVDELKRLGVDMKKLAHKGVQTFFTQVFRHNFFHADMHPGNIFVDVTDPSNPSYIALDCAIVGSLSDIDQEFLAKNLLAFFNRDYATIAGHFVDNGWVPADTDRQELTRVISQVCEPIFAKPLAEISFADFVMVLLKTAADFQMDLQPQLALLQKTLLYVEGLGRQLYPQLDLWETAKPFMEEWAQERFNPFTNFSDRLLVGLGLKASADEERWRTFATNLAAQNRTLVRVEQEMIRQRRFARGKRLAGASLMTLGFVLLWQPIANVVMAGDTSLLAGGLGMLLGSAMIMRA
jgi:ubiquinone biosynthesis protein